MAVKAKARKRKKPSLDARLRWLEKWTIRIGVPDEQIAKLRSNLNHLDEVCRREIERLNQAHRSAAARMDQLVLYVHRPPAKGDLRCSVCKKGEPDGARFTYETENGQLCESCWVWHESLKQSLSPKKPTNA